MYCPKCSQQQASAELSFCSRCGFPLAGVTLLLENDGALAQLQRPAQHARNRSRMIKESALLTLAAWSVALLSTVMWDWGSPLETVAKVGALIFFLLGLIGLLRFIYAFVFVKDEAAKAPAFPVTARQAALPSPQDNPLTDYPQRINTREMAPRVSVTENTTRLLDEE